MVPKSSLHTDWLKARIASAGVVLLLIAANATAQAVKQPVMRPVAQIASGVRPESLKHARLKAAGSRAPGLDTELFLPAMTYSSGGKSANSMALADVNGDHRLDVIVVNSGVETNGNSTVGVLLRNSDGTFQPAVAYDTGSANSLSIAVGDIDGDGKPDLVIGNSFISNSVSVLLGHGDGTFAPAVVYSTGTSYNNWSMPVFIADLNGDGKGDVVVLTQFSISTLLGKADGTLETAQNSYGGNGPLTSLALADINHDGILDAVTLTCSDYCVDSEAFLSIGNGDGTFGPFGHLSGGGGNAQAPIVVTDVNHDGIPDLVFGDGEDFGGGAISVLIANGDGTFKPEVRYDLPIGSGVTSMVVTDLNGDGLPDITTASQSLNVLLNNGDGSFHVTQSDWSGVSAVKAADLNLDGKPDLLLLEPSASVVEALLGNGNGTFVGGGLLFPTGGSSPSVMEVLDLNGDGRPDVLVANQDQAGSVGTLLNNKDFVFSRTTTALTSSLNPSVYGQAVTLTATVTADSGTAAGTVAFTDTNGNRFGSSNLVNGVATFTLANLGGGSDSIIAAYQGSQNFGASSSSPLIQMVQLATTTTSILSSHNPANVGQTVIYTPSVQSQYGGFVFGGKITVYDGSTIIGVLPIGGKKTAVKVKYTVPGTHVISAVYSGDGSNLGSTSAPVSERVVAPTTTVVSTSGSPSHAGQPVTFTATVASNSGAVPNGELVTFYDGSKALGSGSLSGGVASYTTSTLKVKTHTIKAIYPGDSIFTTSHGSVVQVVEP